MSRGQNPLVLMMALSLPGAAHSLGLGEIHVDSALNEPLAAEIDIVGATAEELSSLTASIANRETFLRFGAERPAFLASATFKVSHDVKGRPVLAIRSTASFTEPVVNLLVDLRWHNGEVIRQYSLLLDPSGFPAATQMAAAVRSPVVPPVTLAEPAPAAAAADTLAVATPIASTDAESAAPRTIRATTHVKIGAKATLRGVAWRVGARSDSDLKKTMLAVFRANPNAFDGNINRLRLGAVLTIPSASDVSTISNEDASREIHAQMTAWHASPKKVRAAAAPVQAMPTSAQGMPARAQGISPTALAAAPDAATASTAVAADAVRAATKAVDDAAETAALNLRVESLERGLHDMQGQLEREHDKLLGVQAEVRYSEKALNVPVAAVPAPPQWLLQSLIGGMALLAGALGAMLFKLRRRETPKISANGAQPVSATMVKEAKPATQPAAEQSAPRETPRETPRTMPRPVKQDSNDLGAAWNSVRTKPEVTAREQTYVTMDTEEAAPHQPVFTVNEDELQAAYEDTLDLSGETAILPAEMAAGSGDTANLPAATLNLNARQLRAAGTPLDTTKLDYDLLDLDLTAQHVQMPSVLHERVVAKERRTNLVDVLKRAVEREPDRRDLRMKLLETYYAAAAANRQGFLEVVQKLARDRDRLDEGEWDKIVFMGKQIASDTALFSSDPEGEDDNVLADCA